MKKILLLAFLLCAFIQANATEWTDGNGNTWSFTVNGTEATDIRFLRGPNSEMIYLYGDPNRSEEEKAEDPQEPFKPGAWDAAAMRFSSTEGSHFPTIPDEVYFGLKTLIFDVAEVTPDFDLKVMNGWWSNTYYDHVKWVDGLNELPITQTMADECAQGGEGRDLDLMLYSGSVTIKSVYYESYDVSGAVAIPAKVYVGSAELTVTSIGSSAFYNCSGLTSVTIPSTVTSIGSSAFDGCSGLTSVTIPNSVTSIGDYAFSGCSSLMSVTIPNSVTSISNSTFSYCFGLTSVTIPNSVTSIGDLAFFGCSSLTSVTIPSSVTRIGDKAFSNCSGLTSVTIPNSVTSISNSTFSYCSGLTSVNIPSSVTSIGNYAFDFCFSLTSVTIPEGVTSIGDWAFYGCLGLTSVNIPSSVTFIGSYAFNECESLTSVTINSDAIMSEYNASSINIGDTFGSQVKEYIIGGNVTSIGYGTFYGCSSLTKVNIGENVTSIGANAFYGCTGLTSMTIPSSVTFIGESAFEGCSNITDLKLNCETIENWFADSKTSLKTLTIGEGTTTISDSAFEGFSVLTTVSLGSNVSNIGANAFAHLSKLEDVYCYAIRYPRVDASTFEDSYVEYVTLHVPEVSLQQYKNHAVWGLFFEIVPIDEPSAITDIEGDGNGLEIEAIYDLNGQRQQALRPGINIIKMSDGTIKKVMVK